MVMRSFRISRLVLSMKSKAAVLKLKEKVQKRYGLSVKLKIKGNKLIVEGEGIGNYRVRNWIFHQAKEN
jgi:hypothetical protein